MANIYHLYGLLADIDDQITPLVEKRQMILKKIQVAERIAVMRQKADVVTGIAKDISSIKDPTYVLFHVNTRLTPWRHNLPRVYFEKTLMAIPESLPSNWTRAQAAEFFSVLTKALEEDVAALEETCSDE
jgi:hypothetical protein